MWSKKKEMNPYIANRYLNKINKLLYCVFHLSLKYLQI